MKRVDKEAMDWATEAIKEVEAYEAANPDWRRKSKSWSQFKAEAMARLGCVEKENFKCSG